MYRESELQKQLVRIKPLLQTSLLVIMAYCQITYVQAATTDNSACYNNRDGEIIYVDASSKGVADGRSWSTAFRSLQNALNHAQAMAGKKQMWVASGRYISEKDGFSIPSNVHLYGGFNGKETAFKKRSHTNNVTVLSGNNVAHHVVNVAQATNVVLDGFIIRRGNATGDLNADEADSSNEVRGGGVYSVDSDLSICNSMFIRNRAKKFGGAIFQQGGKLRITKSRFLHNTVLRGVGEVHDTDAEADTDGGAIAIHEAEEFRIEHSVFADNIAGDDAGAIASRKTNVDIKNSRFVRNKGIGTVLPVNLGPGVSPLDLLVTGMGGALQIWNEYIGFNNGDQSYRTVIKDSYFQENRSVIGGAAYIETQAGSEVILDKNIFINNGGSGKVEFDAPVNERQTAFGRGAGALMIVGMRWGDQERDSAGNVVRQIPKVRINNSLFKENEGAYGGGVQLLTVDAVINNSFFYRNIGRQRGGAVWNHNTVSLFEQLAGLEPGIGGVKINHSFFIENKSLGISESLSVDNFPGIITPTEPSFGGGAISNEALAYADINNSIFLRNESINSDGGAIHNSAVSIDVFGNLNPKGEITYGADLDVRNSYFKGNKTVNSGSGGAIANGGAQKNGMIRNSLNQDVRNIAAGSNLNIIGNSFIENLSAGIGGAIVNWNASELEVNKSKFKRNRAQNGGAVASVGFVEAKARAKLSHNMFTQNTATKGRGGAIFNSTSNLLLSKNKYKKNRPDAIYKK